MTRSPGGGAVSTRMSSSCSTPRLSTAAANTTGLVRPARNDASSCRPLEDVISSASSTAVCSTSPSRSRPWARLIRVHTVLLAPPLPAVKAM